MLDNRLRSVKDMLLVPLARLLFIIHPTIISVIGLIFGLIAAGMLVQQQYLWAFGFWLLNRLFDGLDGAVARVTYRQSDLGGYLDILFDFVIYGAIPVALVVGTPTEAGYVTLALLLGTFYVNAASWMYLSAILEKRAHGAKQQDELTSVTMPGGIVGGTETILFYSTFILWPGQVPFLFSLMTLLVAITIVQRVIWAGRHLN